MPILYFSVGLYNYHTHAHGIIYNLYKREKLKKVSLFFVFFTGRLFVLENNLIGGERTDIYENSITRWK